MGSRVIRAGFKTSETINALHDKTARLWLHLYLSADDYGLIELGYGAVRQAAPLQNWTREEVAKMLGELVDAGLLLPYEHNGAKYGALTKWQSNINSVKPRCPVPNWGLTHMLKPTGFKDRATREAVQAQLTGFDWNTDTDRWTPGGNQLTPSGPPSGLPSGPQVGQTTSGTPSGPTVTPPVGQTVNEGVRGKGLRGKDLKTKDGATRGSRLPQGWVLPHDWEAWALDEAKAKGKPVQPSTVSEWALQFRDYWHSVPGAKGLKLDWPATWRNAVRDLYLPKVPASAHAGNGAVNPFQGGI